MADFQLWIIIFSFLIGAVFGSFITALVYRTRHQRSMNESHSICPHCKHELNWIDLVPIVSFIMLRGRCRYCRKSIGWQYLATEIATAILFAASSWLILDHALSHLLLFGGNENWIWVVASMGILWTGIVLLISLFIYDVRWMELPNYWTIGGSALFISASIIAILFDLPLLWQPTNAMASLEVLWQTLISGLAAALFFLIIIVGSEKFLHRQGMGMGDAKLGLFMGFLLGFPGIVVALYLAFILGSVLSLLLIAGKRTKFGNTIPFGPFLVMGTIIALWVTQVIAEWYHRMWL